MKKKSLTTIALILIATVLVSGCVQQPNTPEPQTTNSETNQGTPPASPSTPKGPSPNQLIKEQAVEQLDASLCETISDKNIKEGCFFEIANRANDASLCTEMEEESKRKYCEAAAGS